MNKKELENEIAKTRKQLEALQDALSKATEDEEVPDILRFQNGETYYSMATTGSIIEGEYYDNGYTDHQSNLMHRYFKTRKHASMFTERVQFIANLLHFKYLYDRDYEPNWIDLLEYKYYIFYNGKTKKFEWCYTIINSHPETVYFSTKEIAQKCVDWLNEKNKE